MTLETFLAYGAAAAALGLAVFVLWREGRLLAYQALALGLVVLAAREILTAQSLQAVFESRILYWQRLRLLAASCFPFFWLLFAVTFARADPGRFVRRWKYALAASLLAPIGITVAGWDSLVIRTPYPTPSWLIPVGSAGYWLHVVLLLGTVAILMNLESTLRASSGSIRWQIKFTVLGLGALFGVELFLSSQVLLYSAIQTTLIPFGSAALLLASGFIGFSFLWRRLGTYEVYPSQALLYNSLTLLVVGLYLLAVAGLVEIIDLIGGDERAPLVFFVVLIAIVGLALLLLSTELQERVKRFVNRHLQRPTHDYRRIWNTFTTRTSSIVEIEPLCAALTSTAAEVFGCSAATIWLKKEGDRKLSLGGSTAFSTHSANTLLEDNDEGRSWLEAMEGDLQKPIELADEIRRVIEGRYSMALRGNDEALIGFLTVNERVTKQPYGLEDFALLETFADQVAATIENRQLTRELQKAKEMEAFQAMATFFIHDLKNLASRLSLAMQNLPLHFDKPEFREDLLKTMGKSVGKIDTMTSRLSSLNEGLTLHRVSCDLNHLVHETLAGLNGSMRASTSEDFGELPRIDLDPEQIQKVLTNLLLNAQEAMGESGHITVRTSRENGWVLLSVSDDGCGMSAEFVRTSLFKPFQTTKKQGLGIGLFHTKTIVEAHGGKIEVQSERGAGTTFRVLLPSGAGHQQS